MIYLAGPLFTAAERRFNRDLARVLEGSLGMKVILPQEESGETASPEEIFRNCIGGLERSNLVVALLDGPDSDSGTSFEAGYAYAKGIPVIGVRTDFRMTGEDRGINIMLSRGCRRVVSIPSLKTGDILNEIAEGIGKELKGMESSVS